MSKTNALLIVLLSDNPTSSTTDPYIKVYLIHKGKQVFKWKTCVKKNTLLPVFNEPFQFDISAMDMEEVSLQLWVMDRDRLIKNTRMGLVHVGANSLQESGQKHWQEALNSHDHMTSRWHTIIPKPSPRPTPSSSPLPPDTEQEGTEEKGTPPATCREEI